MCCLHERVVVSHPHVSRISIDLNYLKWFFPEFRYREWSIYTYSIWTYDIITRNFNTDKETSHRCIRSRAGSVQSKLPRRYFLYIHFIASHQNSGSQLCLFSWGFLISAAYCLPRSCYMSSPLPSCFKYFDNRRWRVQIMNNETSQ